MNTNQKCPCKECLLIPRCKFKPYDDLVRECSLVQKHLYNWKGNRNILFNTYMKKLEKVMKPVKWRISHNDDRRITVWDIRQ